jgi:hypothetical protein
MDFNLLVGYDMRIDQFNTGGSFLLAKLRGMTYFNRTHYLTKILIELDFTG